MSLIDQDGKPVAYGWNDDAVAERCERNRLLRTLPDEEFEMRFPELFPEGDPPAGPPHTRR